MIMVYEERNPAGRMTVVEQAQIGLRNVRYRAALFIHYVKVQRHLVRVNLELERLLRCECLRYGETDQRCPTDSTNRVGHLQWTNTVR